MFSGKSQNVLPVLLHCKDQIRKPQLCEMQKNTVNCSNTTDTLCNRENYSYFFLKIYNLILLFDYLIILQIIKGILPVSYYLNILKFISLIQ